MIQNVGFSLGVVLPIFLVILLGFVLRRLDFVDQEFVKRANRLVFYIALPLKLFNDVRTMNISQVLDPVLFAFAAVAIVLSFFIAWGFACILKIEPEQRGSFVQGSFRGNFLYVGFTLIENITGTLGPKPPMVLALTIPLYNILSILLFAFYKPEGAQKTSIGTVLKDLSKNPMILGIFAGVLAALFSVPVPAFALKSVDYVQSLATPLALLSIGASFDWKRMGKKIFAVGWATALKLGILPLLAVLAGRVMGFPTEDVITLYVLFGVPTSTVSFIFAVAMEGDGELASSIIMSTTLFSVFSTTLFVFAFKTLGML